MSLGWQSKEEVEEYLQNLGIEYRFQCYSEKRPDGCHRLGDFLESIKAEYDKAAIVYQMNCDTYDNPRSCFKFGNYKILGRGCKADGETSAKYHEKACALGHPVACYQAAVLRMNGSNGAHRDHERGVELLESACDKDDSESCYFLSSMYLPKNDADAFSQDPSALQRAFRFSKKACDLNHIYACVNLYQLYKRGLGCAKDDTLAATVRRKAEALRNAVENPQPGIVFGE